MGFVPSYFRLLFDTTKYGIGVPSLEVTDRCSILYLLASKNSGSDFIFVTVPAAASPVNSVVGVRKSVNEKKKYRQSHSCYDRNSTHSGALTLEATHFPLLKLLPGA